MKSLLSLVAALAFAFAFASDAPAASSSGIVNQQFLQSGAGTKPRALVGCPAGKLCDDVSVFDFMTAAQIRGVRARTGAVNATAALQAAITKVSGAGGGVIRAPAGTYVVTGSAITLPANVWLAGETPVSTYDTVNMTGGSVFVVTTGDYAVHLSGRQSRLSNIFITGTGGTTEYCVVVTIPNTVVDGVGCHAFAYGFVGAALNSNIFWNITALLNTKVGFVVLPANVGGIGAFAYPKIDALVSGTTSTTFLVGGHSKFNSNKIGVAMLAGYNATFRDVVVESNQYYGLLIFKGAANTTDRLLFERVWFEDDATDTNPWSLAGIDVLKTSAGAFLESDTLGAWSNVTEEFAGIWIGAATEGWDQGGHLGLGPSTGNTFRDCWMGPNGHVMRIRAARMTRIERSMLQSASGATPLNLSTNAYRTELVDLLPIAFQTQLSTFAVTGGLYTVHRYTDTPFKGSLLAVAHNTFTNLVDLAAMTPHNKYEYVFGISGACDLGYCARGYVTYDGTVATLVKESTGAGVDAQLSGTTLQVKHTTGSAESIRYKLHPRGPTDMFP